MTLLAGCRPTYDWHKAGLRLLGYNFFLRRSSGTRVQKVSIDAGFTCPNVDGTVAPGGAVPFATIAALAPAGDCPGRVFWGKSTRASAGCDGDTTSIGFWPISSPRQTLMRRSSGCGPYDEALSHPAVVGLAIGTRPDCVPDEVLDLLEQIAGKTYLSVEYGMQTIHDRSLDWMNRGHHHDAFLDAMRRSRRRGFEICVHVILGLPGESRGDMLATAPELGRLDVDAVKIHNLYAVKDTPLAEQVARGEVELMGRDEYIATLVEILELLSPTTVVEPNRRQGASDVFRWPRLVAG